MLRRFITPDTVIQDYYNPQDLNRYSYAWNNPLRIIDPTGHGEQDTLNFRDYLGYSAFEFSSNPYCNAAATFAQSFLTAPFTMPYRIGWSFGEVIDNLFISPSNWVVRGDTPPNIVSMKNEFDAGNPNPAIRALGTVAGDIVAYYLWGKALSAGSASGYAYRALNAKDTERLSQGLGLEAKNPAGNWSLGQHITDGSNPRAWANDPYISTTLDLKVAKAFNSSGNQLGVIKIDLSKIP